MSAGCPARASCGAHAAAGGAGHRRALETVRPSARSGRRHGRRGATPGTRPSGWSAAPAAPRCGRRCRRARGKWRRRSRRRASPKSRRSAALRRRWRGGQPGRPGAAGRFRDLRPGRPVPRLEAFGTREHGRGGGVTWCATSSERKAYHEYPFYSTKSARSEGLAFLEGPNGEGSPRPQPGLRNPGAGRILFRMQRSARATRRRLDLGDGHRGRSGPRRRHGVARQRRVRHDRRRRRVLLRQRGRGVVHGHDQRLLLGHGVRRNVGLGKHHGSGTVGRGGLHGHVHPDGDHPGFRDR